MNAWKERQARGEAAPAPTSKTCPACLETIAIGARKCKWCAEPQAM
jgi:hypothetical protein